jgi:hypothetical protein
MHWLLYTIVAALQVADVATTEIGRRTVAGFYELNPIVAFLAGQPPALWKLIVLKAVVLAFVGWIVWVSEGGTPIKVTMGLAVVLYVAIVWNNIGVIG